MLFLTVRAASKAADCDASRVAGAGSTRASCDADR
jgi:hypothetical protein